MPVILGADANPGVASFMGFGEAAASTPLFATGTGNPTPETRLVVASNPAGILIPPPQINLPDDYPVGVPLAVVRTDSNGNILLAVPESGNIDGTTDVSIPDASGGASAFVFMFDGTNWWTVAST